MSRRVLAVAARVAAVAGIVGATAMQGVAAHATDSVSFLSCTSPTPTPTASGGSGPSGPSGNPTPAPTPTATPDNCVPASGTVITDVRTMRFSVATNTTGAYIDQVQAFIDSHTNGVASPDASRVIVQCPTGDEDASKAGCQSANAAPRNGIYAVPWDTNDLTPYNGFYTFRVRAHFTRQGNTYSKTVEQPTNNQCSLGCNLIVDNPPVQPNAPRIVVTTASSVSLAWDANPEPDITSYSIYRAVTKDKKTAPTDAQFKLDFVTVGTSVRETVKDSGAYWYKVQATRRSFSPEHKDAGISSPLSARSGAGVVSASAGTGKKSTKSGGHVVALPPPPAAVLTPPGLIPAVAAAPPPVPDAPYSAFLPYKSSGATSEDAGPPAPEAGAGVDPRGAVLPVAVGAFLVSSALALGRMPF
jgi:hypothetical protein